MYIRLQVMYRLFSPVQNFTKIRPDGAEFFHAD